MFCTICGKENREGAKFCRYCGHKLDEEVLCPRCGSTMEADDVFCERCGYKKGDTLEVKPIVEEKKPEEYPVFESETPIEYGDEKPIIEEYDDPASDKTIEDYMFSDYEEIPHMDDPFATPVKDETFAEIASNIPVEEKKEIKADKIAQEKEEKKQEKSTQASDGKFVNVFILLSSLTIIVMMFLPFYSARNTGEYIRGSFAGLRESYFMNFISFVKLVFNGGTHVFGSRIDRLYYLLLVIGMAVIIISMLKVFFFAIRNLKDRKHNVKYEIPFVVALISILSLYVICNVNSIPVYVVLSLCLAVLIHKYFYEKRFGFMEFVKTILLLGGLGFFLFAYRNIGLKTMDFEGFTSWSKLGIGKYYQGLGIALGELGDKNYIKDLISFLGWSVALCFAFGLLMGIIVLIKIVKAIYSDEPESMPIVSMAISTSMLIAGLIFMAFAKGKCEKQNSAFIEGCSFNAWIILALIAGVILCAIFGLMNYKLNKAIKKEKEQETKIDR